MKNKKLTEKEKIEIECIIGSYIDAHYNMNIKGLEKVFKRKLHFRGNSIKRYNKDVFYYRIVIMFLAFNQSVGKEAFLDYLENSDFFEKIVSKYLGVE